MIGRKVIQRLNVVLRRLFAKSRLCSILVMPQYATLQETCGSNNFYAFSGRCRLINAWTTPDNFVDLIALPVLVANFSHIAILAYHRHRVDACLPARLRDIDRVVALADVFPAPTTTRCSSSRQAFLLSQASIRRI